MAAGRILSAKQAAQPAEQTAAAALARDAGTLVIMPEDGLIAHVPLCGIAHGAALAHAHTVAKAVVGHAGGTVFVRAKVKAVARRDELLLM